MWALRRAYHIINYGAVVARSCSLGSKCSCQYNGDAMGVFQSPFSDKFYHVGCVSSQSPGFSSQAHRCSGKEDDCGNVFSELGALGSGSSHTERSMDIDEELTSELDHTVHDDEKYSENRLEMGTGRREFRSQHIVSSALFKAIVAAPSRSMQRVLDKWLEEGKDLGRTEIWLTMNDLRKRQMYQRALQLSEWLQQSKPFPFVERDYVSRVDLIAKVHGLEKAENYIATIPESFRGEYIYRTLLANCVVQSNIRKAEEVFNKMRDQEFPLTTFACDQLLLLYKRLDTKKIADVLLLMEKENVRPSQFSFRVLIGVKGLSNDLKGLDQLVEMMKAEGVEPTDNTLATLARHYISLGMKEKAEAILKRMEGGSLREHRSVCHVILPAYAELGKKDEVRRVWGVCKLNPMLDECTAAIEAWGKLKEIGEAEAVFNQMMKMGKRLSSKHFSALLEVYVENKMMNKGKDLVRCMTSKGCHTGPLIWDALVRLYVEAGEVEKADSFLHKAIKQSSAKPLYSSFRVIMDEYAKRGDIHKTEKIFHQMRLAGYAGRGRLFHSLIQAYINAKAPAYGLRERMEADNIFPDKALVGQLGQVNPFKRTNALDLLE